MKNHYFIGIGGTGGNILREIRKTLFVRQQNTEAAAQNKANYEFLYVDSNEHELNNKEQWRILGQYVQLEVNQRLLILEGNIAQVIANVGQTPALGGWVGQRDKILGLVGQASGVPGAQQRRRFGRFLFAVPAQQFVDRVKQGVSHIMTRGQGVANECTFHLMGTLAGGTGSGGLVDAALQLRSEYPDAASFPIKLYCLITHSGAGGADVGYFYPNQYAALKDINAVLSGTSNFHDVRSPQGSRISSGNRAPILVCYLTSHANESNIALAKPHQEHVIAEWLLEVTQAEAAARLNAQTLKALTGEDLLAAFPGEPLSKTERSYAFASLGIRRWAIPQGRLRERLAYRGAEALANQILFAHWNNGYQAEIRPNNATGFLNQNPPEALGFNLHQLADPEAVNGRGIDAEWGAMLRNFQLRAGDDEDALAQLKQEVQAFGTGGFLGTGVKSFFSTRRNQTTAEVRRLVSEICARLKEAVNRKDIGIEDVLVCLTSYLQSVQTLLKEVEDRLTDKKRDAEEASNRAREIEAKWQRPGILATFVGARKKLLGQAVVAFEAQATANAWQEGYDLARLVLQGMVASLQAIHKSVLGFKTATLTVRRELAEDAGQSEQHLQTRDDLMTAFVVKDAMSGLEDRVLADWTYMSAAAQEAHETLLKDVGLADIQSRVSQGAIRDSLETAGDLAGRNAHDHYAAVNPADRLLNENLVRALHRVYATRPQELREEVESFVRGAVTALRLDGAAVQPAATLGANIQSMPSRAVLLLIPTVEESHLRAFRQDVVNLFTGAIANVGSCEVEESPDASEITLVAVNGWMASRFAEPVPRLKQKYEEAMARTDLNAAYFCHLDDEASKLPDLLPPDTAMVRDEGGRWLDIAQKLHIVQSEGSQLHLISTDGDGVTVARLLGTRDQTLNLPDSELAKLTIQIKQQASSGSQDLLKGLEASLLVEMKSLPERTPPTRPEYAQELDRLKWMREQVKAMIKA